MRDSTKHRCARRSACRPWRDPPTEGSRPSGPRPRRTPRGSQPSVRRCVACWATSSSTWCPTHNCWSGAASGAPAPAAPWCCWPAAARARRPCGWSRSGKYGKNRPKRLWIKPQQLSIVNRLAKIFPPCNGSSCRATRSGLTRCTSCCSAQACRCRAAAPGPQRLERLTCGWETPSAKWRCITAWPMWPCWAGASPRWAART